MTELYQTHPSAPPAPPPREASALARRRLWAEPHVRFWWVTGVVLMLGLAISIGAVVFGWVAERRLLARAVAVQAVIKQIGPEILNRPQRPDIPVTLEFPWAGRPYRTAAQKVLEGQTAYIAVGETVEVFVDPDNPERWTARREPGSLLQRMLGPVIIAPLVPLVLLVGWARWRAYLRVWREGEAIEALVLNSRRTALAPSSRAVQVTPESGRDRSVVTVFVPRSAPSERGDLLWLIVHPRRRGPALAAEWVGDA